MMSDKAFDLAIAHVDWFLSMLRPLLISHFEHGFKHGIEFERDSFNNSYQSACSTIAKSLNIEEY